MPHGSSEVTMRPILRAFSVARPLAGGLFGVGVVGLWLCAIASLRPDRNGERYEHPLLLPVAGGLAVLLAWFAADLMAACVAASLGEWKKE